MKRHFELLDYIQVTLIGIGMSGWLFSACNPSSVVDEKAAVPVISVQIISVTESALGEYVDLPAVSAYFEKSFVKANMNGYVKRTSIKMGQQVEKGQLLFSLVTKEARSIGNTVNKLDSGFKFSGISALIANAPGIIVQVNHQQGDYVQDGEAMATISNRNSLVFLLDLPYELNNVISSNKHLEIMLPDGKKLTGLVSGTMPSVDSLAQTQRFIIRVNAVKDLPEGLIGSVRLAKVFHPRAQVLPKSAILSNETEDDFWVMKLINDSTAVKINVDKGIESNDMIEVLRPKFAKSDKIITTGNYGLADTARVKIQQ